MSNWTAEDLAAHYQRLTTPPADAAKPKPKPTGRAPWTAPMNGTERAYSGWLQAQKAIGEVLWFAFEPMKILLGPGATYTPDFLVLYADGRLEAHDTKGTKKIKTGRKAGQKTCWVEEHALVKVKITTAVFPVPIFLVYSTGTGEWAKKGFGE